MSIKGQSILSSKQFDRESLLSLFEEAKRMEEVKNGPGSCDDLKGKVMASVFFEPSTRTRFSFESAMLRLGGKVISNPDMLKNSSVKKRETLFDTGKVLSQLADVIAMRHPEQGSVAEMEKGSDVPVMNAGDGPGDHPTQGLLDVYTMYKTFGKLDGLTVGMVGDLKYGRVPHADAHLLSHFGVKFVFVAPEALMMPREIVDHLRGKGLEVVETESLEEVIGELDVIGMTRVQEERFESTEEYQKYAGAYILGRELMSNAKAEAIVLHPLPRVDEIEVDLDEDPRCKYFEQVHNGVCVRMALLKQVLS